MSEINEFEFSMDEDQIKQNLKEEENLIEDKNIVIRPMDQEIVIPGQNKKKDKRADAEKLISFQEPQPQVLSSRINTLSVLSAQEIRKKAEKQMARVGVTDLYESNTKKEKKSARKKLKSYEKQYKDYQTFGLAFDMEHAVALPTDSSYMKKIKNSLAVYLSIRENVFEQHQFSELSAQDLAYEDAVHEGRMNNRHKANQTTDRHYDSRDALNDEERERMGRSIDELLGYVDSYLHNTGKYFNVARGRARYRQVEKLKEQLLRDDFRFYISERKRRSRRNLDNSYRVYDGTSKDFVDRFVNAVMPTWQRAMFMEDMVKMQRYAYREKRREERAKGELPGYCWRTAEWIAAFLLIRGYKVGAFYNQVGAFVDRSLGTAAMIAANTLELGGKIIKAPLKILSMVVNGINKGLGFKKRWKMKFSLRENWKSIDDGRKIFRRYLKGACVIPTAILETLTRGIPTLFGHRFKSGVYKRTSKWTNDILRDGKALLRSIGIQDKALYRRMEVDEATAGRLSYNANIKDYEVDQKEDEADELFDEEMAALDEAKELNRPVAQQEQPVAQREQPIVQQEQGQQPQQAAQQKNEQEQQPQQIIQEEQPQQQNVQDQGQQQKQVEPAKNANYEEAFNNVQTLTRKKVTTVENLTWKKVTTVETLSRLFLKKDEDLVYTEDLSALTAKQLTDLKELCVKTLSEQTGTKKEDLSLYPLYPLVELTKQANEDYPDQNLLKSHFESGLKELEDLLDNETLSAALDDLACSEEELKDLPESKGFEMKEYALLSLHRIPEVKHIDAGALSDLSPSKLVELSKSALFFTKNYEEGQDEATLEKLREAAVTILVLTTDLPETKFMMRPMEELNTLVTKALSGLDDRKALAKETLDFLEKIPEFDVETEILNDREVELLNRERGEMTGAELLKQKNVAERVLSKKAGRDRAELDLLPMEFKLSLARSVWESKDSEDEIAWEVSYKIDQYLNGETLTDQMNRIDEIEILPDESESVLADKRDAFAFGLAKAGLAEGITRRDLDRVPPKDLQEASSFALMIAQTPYAELDQGELKDYRESLSRFLMEYAWQDENELAFLPTGVLTDYAKQLISGILRQDDALPVAEPMAESYIDARIEALAQNAFEEGQFDSLSGKEDHLELKELITYRILKGKNGDRDAMMKLSATDLYFNVYLETDQVWLSGEEAVRHKVSFYEAEKDHRAIQTSWSDGAQKTVRLLSDLTSGIGVTDQMGNALSAEVRVLEVFKKHAEVIADLAKGEAKSFQELSAGCTRHEAPLISGLKEVVMSLVNDLSKLKEKTEDKTLKDAAWSRKTVEALLATEEGQALFQEADSRILSFIEKWAKPVEDMIGDAAKDIFVDEEEETAVQKDLKESEKKEDPIEEIPSLTDLDEDYLKTKEERKNARIQKERNLGLYKEENESVKKLNHLRDQAYGKGSVQGRFLQASLSGYYKKSSPESKRLMLSELLRNIKPVRRYTKEHQSQRNAIYFEGVVKGAGPVLQKLLQGIPEKMIKPLYQKALQAAKSELRHLPDAYVQAKLDEIAKNAKKPVASIKKKAELGAASVAETFLCDVRYADGTKEEVVVKLLRPDAEARMLEESQILTSIAKEEDKTGVMEGSISSHITEIKKEFDFRKEAGNTEKGKAYETASLQKGTVKTVQINENFETKKDSFVMNKAEGESCDRYLEKVNEKIETSLAPFKNPGDGDPEALFMTEENADSYFAVKSSLVDELKKLENRKKHLIRLSEQWVQEALYGNLFHHGDLHSGNLMINDQCVTVLDYGNANTFTKDQVTLIIRMMVSAISGNAGLFTDNLEKLISSGNKEAKPLPEKVKTAFIDSLKEVFSLGHEENAGARIFVALQKAEEAGIRLPHEIQNFSRCEQRLENTINEFNRVRENLVRAIRRLEHLELHNSASVRLNPTLNLQCARHNVIGMVEKDPAGKHLAVFQKEDEETLEKEMVQMKSEEFETLHLGVAKDAYDKMQKKQKLLKSLPKSVDSFRKEYEAIMKLQDPLERFQQAAELNQKLEDLAGKLNAPISLLSNISSRANDAVAYNDPELFDEVMQNFLDLEKVMDLMKKYNEATSFATVRKGKYRKAFVKDYVAFSEKLKNNQYSMKYLRSELSPDLRSRVDIHGEIVIQLQAFDPLSDSFLAKDEQGNYVYGKPAEELEAVWKRLVHLKDQKKNVKLTPQEEADKADFQRLKFYVGAIADIQETEKKIRRQLDKVFKEETFGKEMEEKYTAFRKAQDHHLEVRMKKNPDQNEIREAGKVRKEAEEAFLNLYRPYLVREMKKIRRLNQTEPETSDINFVDVMRKQVKNNKLATINYLGGITQISKYTSQDLDLNLTEEEKKKLDAKK